jgi:hypothetical protein
MTRGILVGNTVQENLAASTIPRPNLRVCRPLRT